MFYEKVVLSILLPLFGAAFGAVVGCYLTYKFTARFEKEKIVLSIKIDILRDLLSENDKLEKLAVFINNSIENSILKNETDKSYINSDINKFINESNAFRGKIEVNEIFLKDNLNLYSIWDKYNKKRSIFGRNHQKAIDQNNTDINDEHLNTLLINYMDVCNELNTELNKTLHKLLLEK